MNKISILIDFVVGEIAYLEEKYPDALWAQRKIRNWEMIAEELENGGDNEPQNLTDASRELYEYGFSEGVRTERLKWLQKEQREWEARQYQQNKTIVDLHTYNAKKYGTNHSHRR